MKSLRLLALVLAFALAPAAKPAEPAPAAPAAAPAAKPKTFLIVLRLVPRLYDDQAWTEADNAAIGAHFQRLKAATAAGQVILAGRTNEPGEKTMGLIIFTAADEPTAREFMDADPCIVAGVMTGTLHPYGIALMKKS
jgi:uncharacterized protein YciI